MTWILHSTKESVDSLQIPFLVIRNSLKWRETHLHVWGILYIIRHLDISKRDNWTIYIVFSSSQADVWSNKISNIVKDLRPSSVPYFTSLPLEKREVYSDRPSLVLVCKNSKIAVWNLINLSHIYYNMMPLCNLFLHLNASYGSLYGF